MGKKMFDEYDPWDEDLRATDVLCDGILYGTGVLVLGLFFLVLTPVVVGVRLVNATADNISALREKIYEKFN